MKSRRALSLSLLLTTCMLTQPMLASAQETYLLQLGSFETREEAQKRWEVLQGKYPDMLSGLTLRVMDVTLPPDNFTVYRTQAGPLKSNANATTLCDRLTSRGDECYVVETAMYAPNAEPGSVPNPPLVVADDFAIREMVKSSPEETSEIAAPAPDAAPESVTEAPETPAESADAEPVAPIATPALESALPDPVDLEAQATQENPQAYEQEAVASAEDAAPVSTPAPLETTQAEVPQSEEAEEESFWSFLGALNPMNWGGEEENQPEPTVDEAPQLAEDAAFDMAEAAPTVPVESTVSAEVPPAPEPLLSAPPQQFSQPVTDMSLAQSPPVAPMPWHLSGSEQPQPTEVELAPAAGSLPQPPLPPEEDEFRMASQHRLDTALQTGTIAKPMTPMASAAPASAPVIPDNAPFAVKQDPNRPVSVSQPDMVPPPPAIMGSDLGDVTVAEAVPVPLSERAAHASVSGVPSPALGLPSQTLHSRSLWAQLGYFTDEQAALGYWEGYRIQHPELPTLRTRVVKPYNSDSQTPRVSLRVGPFEEPHQVSALCEQLANQEVTCRPVAELGTSASQRGRGGALPSRYGARQASGSVSQSDMYWVQLGSFPTQAAADGNWEDLKQKHNDIMKPFESDVTSPALSSGEANFRLRSGPFALRHKADALCDTLKMRGETCLVMFGK